MSVETIKLTTYFGERDRADGQLLADSLLDLYGERGLTLSVLVRGIEGFGRSHREHTDQLVTLSEDLPVVSYAVDSRERIEETLPAVLALRSRGLVTLERAELLSGHDQISQVAEQMPEHFGDESKLTIYVGRRERVSGKPAFVAVCELLRNSGVAGATVLLGVDGTRHGKRTRARFFHGNAEVPLAIIAVGNRDAVAAAAQELGRTLERPLITLERVSVTRRGGVKLTDPQPLEPVLGDGLRYWHKLVVHSNEEDRVGRHPLHRELVRVLRRSKLAGATSLRGIWGYHDDGPPHGDRVLAARRGTPVMTIAIDSPERIAEVYEQVQDLTADSGLVTFETVPVIPS